MAGGDGRARLPRRRRGRRPSGRSTPARARGLLADLVALHARGAVRAAAAADRRRARLRPHPRGRRQRGRRAGRGDCAAGAKAASRSATTRSTPGCSVPAAGPEVLIASASPGGEEPTRFGDPRPAPVASAARRGDPPLGAAVDRRPARARRPTRRPFDVCGALPTGTTVLEASAGTGKTFTIAALATRYVAEGHARLPELLLVTFGREATQELRERVRERLAASAERGLRDPAAARVGADSGWRRCWRRRGVRRRGRAAPPSAHRRAGRVRRRDHRDHPPVLPADADRRSASPPTTRRTGVRRVRRRPGRRGRRRLLRAQVRRPRCGAPDVRPGRGAAAGPPRGRRPAGPAGARPTPAERHRAAAARLRVGRPRRGRATQAAARGLHTYDDLVTRLQTHWPTRVRGAGRRLRSRYRVVLVDEFQDTDPLQWGDPAALRRARAAGPDRRPQAGDLRLPRRGRRQLPRRRRARRRPRHAGPQLAQRRRACCVRWTRCSAVPHSATRGSSCVTSSPAHPGAAARRCADRRPAADPRRCRATGWRCSGRGLALSRGRAGLRRPRRCRGRRALPRRAVRRRTASPLRPGDVAVLVRTNDQGTVMRDALAAVGVPAVLSGTASVFGTPGRPRVADAAATRSSSRGRSGSATRHSPASSVAPSPTSAADGADAAPRRAGRDAPPLGGLLRAAGSPRCWRRSPQAPDCPGACSASPDGERRLTDRPARRAGAARRDRRRAPRPGGAGGVAAAPHRRGRGRCRARPQPAARLRRRRSPDRHRAPQQGPRVPRRVRAVRLGPLRPARAGRPPAARRRRPARARRRRRDRAAVGASTARATRPRRPGRTCGCCTWR